MLREKLKHLRLKLSSIIRYCNKEMEIRKRFASKKFKHYRIVKENKIFRIIKREKHILKRKQHRIVKRAIFHNNVKKKAQNDGT